MTAQAATFPRLAGPRRGAAQAITGTGLVLAAALLAMPFAGAWPPAVGLGIYLGGAAIAFRRLEAGHPHPRFGLGNLVTLLRLAGVALLAAVAAQPALAAGPAAWSAVAGTALLLGLDGLDGLAARRQGLTSRFGARFDMEVDALLMLVLAALVHALGKAGIWVLGLGLARYAFVLAGLAAPALRRPLPPSRRRQAVCVLAIAVLGALVAPPLRPPLAQLLAAGALAVLAWSFAVDLRWLARRAR